MPDKPRFFKTPADFRKWLERHHGSRRELLVGFYKSGSGRPSITWPQSVDEALCFGWIDGVRKRVDDLSYTIRFTPRKPTSIWSSINIGRVQALARDGLVSPAGLKAFGARRENKSGIYAYEQRPRKLIEPYAGMLSRNAKARAFFESQAPWYQRTATWWVISAKREETRLKRAKSLIDCSAKEKLLPQYIRAPAAKRARAAS
ncbi:MAG TPA: YdeI/OmpD-associated family protein [Steroidobacteraceae bacterium]|nr:YdeI/OmpD-associated family protein [Steroidobacteraceae bacterium]